jgi:cytochrome c553
MYRNTAAFLLLWPLILGAHTALAAGDASVGQRKSQACQACHGVDGRGSDPSYPVLAGQYASYLAQALGDYRAGRRNSPVMGGIAAQLTDQDILDLAAWYASLEGLQDLSIR